MILILKVFSLFLLLAITSDVFAKCALVTHLPDVIRQTGNNGPMCTRDLGKVFSHIVNSMKLVIPLHSLYWSIHTKDESKRGTAFAFIFGVN